MKTIFKWSVSKGGFTNSQNAIPKDSRKTEKGKRKVFLCVYWNDVHHCQLQVTVYMTARLLTLKSV